MHANKSIIRRDESESKQRVGFNESERRLEVCKIEPVFLSSAMTLTKKSWRRQRTSSLNDEAGFDGSDRGMITLRMTVFTGSSIDVPTAPVSDEVPLQLFGKSACFPSAEKQSSTLLPAIDLAALAVSEGIEVGLFLPAAKAAVCAATSAAGFDRTGVLLLIASPPDPAEAESKRTDRITNNNTKQQVEEWREGGERGKEAKKDGRAAGPENKRPTMDVRGQK